MKTVSQKIELAANVLIIVVALLLGGVLVKKFILNDSAKNNQPPVRVQPAVGSKLEVSDVDWSQQKKTLVLALQTTCHFCNESAPFYKRLAQAAENKNVKIVAVFPTGNEENAAHMKELGLESIPVRQQTLNSLQVSGTPTLILTNEKGEITEYWVGKLPPEKETEVLNKLTS